MQPKISIVIPVYNVGQYLCQCLDSIITQTIQDYEVILVDDGSTDESPSICDKYAEKNKRFTVIHQKNEGSAKARNTGLDKATGEYIAFIDSDDWINEDHLQNLQKRAEETEADIVISSYYFFDGKQDTYVINKASKLDSRTIIMETLNGLLHAGLWNKLFRRGFLVKKEIRFPEHGYYEDMFVFISSLMNTNKIAFSSTATYHYRVNPTSQTFSHDLNKRLSSYDEMIENFELLEKKYHLSQDQEILNALYREINANRQNLFISFRKDAKKLSEHFKKHPIPLVLRDTSPLWGGVFYFACKYGIGWPYIFYGFRGKISRVIHHYTCI